MTTARETIVSRIQKLRKMTEANGASEAEALAAMSAISRLMAEHGLTESDTQLRADAQGMITDHAIIWQATVDEWRALCASIAKLYATVVYTQSTTEDLLDIGMPEPVVHVKFFGYPTDVAACCATLAICVVSVNTEAATAGLRAKDKFSFRFGMVARLNERIREIIAERTPRPGTGTGLVVLKNQLVREEFSRVGPRLRDAGPARSRPLNPAAVAAGRAAADRVDLGNRSRVAGGTIRTIGRS